MPASTSASGLRVGRIVCLAWVAVAAGFALAVPIAAAAQEGCGLGEGSTLYVQEPDPRGGTISYFANPHFECEDDVEIWADSAVAYSALGMSYLMGAVRYVDRTRELRADTARYFSDLGRLQATGHVFITDSADGSIIENGDLVYLRVTDFRDEESITVTTGADGVRPRAVIAPAPDSTAPDAPPPDPYTVVSDRIFILGSYFTAVGDVEIERDSLFAYADSVEYDPSVDYLLLEGSARVVNGGSELVGRTITMATPEAEPKSEASEIRALGDAILVGDDLRITAPQIVVFLSDGVLERLVATPMRGDSETPADSTDLIRPVATVQDVELTADSLEVATPNDMVERVFAAGDARSVSTSRSSLNVDALPEIARSDWLAGDTVIVTFKPTESTSPADTAEAHSEGGKYEVETIVARGNASTLYRLPPSDSTAEVGSDPPAVHYVVGDEITITMVAGEVDAMEVVGRSRGVHLEPLVRVTASDTLADSASVRSDTIMIARDTTLTTLPPLEPRGAERSGSPAKPSMPRREKPWKPN